MFEKPMHTFEILGRGNVRVIQQDGWHEILDDGRYQFFVKLRIADEDGGGEITVQSVPMTIEDIDGNV